MEGCPQHESFWDFSVRTYRTTGVPAASLSLQNDFGADVNMLLYCCWVGAYLGKFDSDMFASASRFSANWAENVVIPLRSARTWMKHTGCGDDAISVDQCMTLRDDVKSVEFAAERLQQDTLESLAHDPRLRNVGGEILAADTASNLALYMDYANIAFTEAVRRKLAVLIMAAFPGLAGDAVEHSLDA